jgi:hypothetical protein
MKWLNDLDPLATLFFVILLIVFIAGTALSISNNFARTEAYKACVASHQTNCEAILND